MSETIYNKIGKGYNTTRKADPYITERLYALLNLQQGNIMDIGCGTGNYTIKLSEKGLSMTGIDPSNQMLDEACKKSANIQWISGYAEHIPLPDNSMDGAIATLTVHHWQNVEKALTDVARVLKYNARLVIFTFTPEQEAGYWFNHFFPEMMQRGMKRSLPAKQLTEYATNAGFTNVCTEKYFVQDDLQDMFGYSGKNDPERYFDPEVINGISYFSIYADENEKEKGLKMLRKSIESGTFNEIRNQYNGDEGDYLFVVLEKCDNRNSK